VEKNSGFRVGETGRGYGTDAARKVHGTKKNDLSIT
jgi:hypothetical protein